MTHNDRGGRQTQAEHDAIRQVSERLAGQFPELSQEQVENLVHGKYDGFAESPVRDFVPTLVERPKRQRLAHERRGSGRA